MMIRQTVKLMLLAGVMITVAQSARAQTCASQPTCADLGYTLTSTGTCVGAVLKCPFDKSKYYCTQKSEVTPAVMPDYSRSTPLTIGTKYTVGQGVLSAYSCGWALMHASDETVTDFYVNEVKIGGQYSWNSADKNDWWNDSNTILVPLSKNDTFQISYSKGKNTAILKFYPCRNY